MLFLSVIICTSQGRESYLERCLSNLTQQTHSNFEVIIADDGSQNGIAIAKPFSAYFPLRYLHRKPDYCVSRSRNLAAAQAQGEILVFLDGDILLNPQALAAYSAHLSFRYQDLLYGYVGYLHHLQSPSFWFPGVQVNWWDSRFEWQDNRLVPNPKLFNHAYEMAWAGNFAIYRSTYLLLKGFDEAFQGWGGEDLDFAERAVNQGREVHFLLDAWAEHQIHDREEHFHRWPEDIKKKKYIFRPHPPLHYTVRVKGSSEALCDLENKIRTHYLPQNCEG
ncbi:MAG: glycosyltransferase [Candidatus Sericytochromatia bacterium]|nr:glycosyltransferase [Candidatus Sericytochromatia bacterium]